MLIFFLLTLLSAWFMLSVAKINKIVVVIVKRRYKSLDL